MSVIDMSEARAKLPAPLPAVKQEPTETLLEQFFAILNAQVPPTVPLEMLDSIKNFQLQGMSIVLEYLTAQFGGAEHPIVVDLRGQILMKQTEFFKAAELAARAAAESTEADA
jgi:hypothetical protein